MPIVNLYNGLLDELEFIDDNAIVLRAQKIDDDCKITTVNDAIILRSMLVSFDDQNYDRKFYIEDAKSSTEIAQNYELNLIDFARAVDQMQPATIEALFRQIYSTIDAAKKNDSLLILCNKYEELQGQMAVDNLFKRNSRSSNCVLM